MDGTELAQAPAAATRPDVALQQLQQRASERVRATGGKLDGRRLKRVARLARSPVWIIRPKDHATAGRIPEIEPPCPACVKHRQETGGAALWCARHAEHHIRPHRYSYATNGVHASSSAAYQATPEGV